MATFTKVPSTRKGGRVKWRAQVRYRGRTDGKTFSTKEKAETWARGIETEIEEGLHFARAAARRTLFADLVADYTKTKLAEFDEVQRATRVQQLAWWAAKFKELSKSKDLSLADVTRNKISLARDALAAETFTKSPRIPDAVCQEVRALAEAGKTHQQIIAATDHSAVTVRRILQGKAAPKEYPRSPATVNRYLATLSHMLSFAAEDRELLDVNPIINMSRKTEPRGRVKFLTDDERARLLDACALSDWGPLHTLVQLALVTGARRSELINLKWADVDMSTGRAIVYETKNGDPRTLPFDGTKALDGLRALKLRNAKTRSAYVFPAPTVVLDPETGKPQLDAPHVHFDGVWHAALKAAKISDFRFHDLRHTCASYLAQQGKSLLEIADVLGHKTMLVVKRYAHLTADHKASVVASMAAAKGL